MSKEPRRGDRDEAVGPVPAHALTPSPPLIHQQTDTRTHGPYPRGPRAIRELYAQGQYRQAQAAAARFGPPRTGPARRRGSSAGGWPSSSGRRSSAGGCTSLALPRKPGLPRGGLLPRPLPAGAVRPAGQLAVPARPPGLVRRPARTARRLARAPAFVAARLRDFDRAERWLNRAEAAGPEPAVAVQSSGRACSSWPSGPDDALAAARRSLELHPWFRPGGAGGRAPACTGSAGTARRSSSSPRRSGTWRAGWWRPSSRRCRHDFGHHADAARSLDRYAELSPLMEPEVAKWLAARRADTAYLLGDYASAARPRPARGGGVLHAASRTRSWTARQTPSGTAVRAASPPAPSFPVDLAYDRTPPTVYELLARFWTHPLPNPPADAAAAARTGCRTRPSAAGRSGRVGHARVHPRPPTRRATLIGAGCRSSSRWSKPGSRSRGSWSGRTGCADTRVPGRRPRPPAGRGPARPLLPSGSRRSARGAWPPCRRRKAPPARRPDPPRCRRRTTCCTRCRSRCST